MERGVAGKAVTGISVTLGAFQAAFGKWER